MKSAPTIVELGSTFYASRVKHQVVEAFAGKATKPTWVGIDNSKLMQDTTDLLHDDAVKVLNHTSLHRGGPGHVLLSRFVASYVFTSAAEHVDFIASNFDAAVIEDLMPPSTPTSRSRTTASRRLSFPSLACFPVW